jgi:hypothetical protein
MRSPSLGSLLLSLIFGVVIGVLGYELVAKSGNVSTEETQPKQSSSDLIDQIKADYEAMLAERKAKQFSKAEATKEIVICTLPNCPPCKQWIDQEWKRFHDAGWDVVICDKPNHGYTRGPTFELTSGGKRVVIVGYLSLDSAEAAIK